MFDISVYSEGLDKYIFRVHVIRAFVIYFCIVGEAVI